MGAFSPQIINALVDAITGGPGMGSQRVYPGLYRSGTKLEIFFRGCNLEFALGLGGSRVPTTRSLLYEVNEEPDGALRLAIVTEAVADPREYQRAPEKHEAVLEYLNDNLRPDGYEIRKVGRKYRLCSTATHAPSTTALQEAAHELDLGSVQRDAERAMAQAEDDPEDAITAACSMVESTCRTILKERNLPLPAKKDISHLVAQVQQHLALSPSREDFPEDIEPDIKQILGGLRSVANGIGALRTHAGDAHGRDKDMPRLDSRIARLAIHAASTLSLFLIETWQKRGPLP